MIKRKRWSEVLEDLMGESVATSPWKPWSSFGVRAINACEVFCSWLFASADVFRCARNQCLKFSVLVLGEVSFGWKEDLSSGNLELVRLTAMTMSRLCTESGIGLSHALTRFDVFVTTNSWIHPNTESRTSCLKDRYA